MKQSRSLASIFILVLPVFLVVGLVWADYRFARSNIGGDGFSIQWIGIQSLAKSGSDPYSDQVTEQIQASVSAENSFVKDNYPKYTSPLYSGVLIFPFTLVGDKTLAHALWMAIQLILIFATILLSLKLTGWNPTWIPFLLFTLFTVFSYHVVMPWFDGGLSIWAGFFLVLALVAIRTNRNELAGILLALTTVQPQMVVLPLIFILLWSISKKRTLLILWFIISMVLLVVVGLFLVPGWVLEYIRLLYHFSDNFPLGTPGLFFSNTSPGLGKQLGWLISGIAGLGLIVEWLLAIKRDFRWFLWAVCLTMVLSQWIGIPTIPAHFIELLIPLILVGALLTERWPRGGPWGALGLSLVLFAWEWGLLYLDVIHPQSAVQLNLIFPLPAVLLIGLFWVRWWAVKPRRLLIEELHLSETY